MGRRKGNRTTTEKMMGPLGEWVATGTTGTTSATGMAPRWHHPWVSVVRRRMGEAEATALRFGDSAFSLSMQKMFGAPNRATRQQIADFYEALLSESYEDWHGMKEGLDDAETTASLARQEVTRGREQIADLQDGMARAGRRLWGLLKLIEDSPPNEPTWRQ